MKNSTIFMAVIAVAAVSGFVIYKSLIKKKEPDLILDKEAAIGLIIDGKAHQTRSVIQDFDTEFLKSWATAVFRKKENFTYNGATYVTVGGKRQK